MASLRPPRVRYDKAGTLDPTSGYWHVPFNADAQDKSAFVTQSELKDTITNA